MIVTNKSSVNVLITIRAIKHNVIFNNTLNLRICKGYNISLEMGNVKKNDMSMTMLAIIIKYVIDCDCHD